VSAAAPERAAVPVTVIRPPGGWFDLDWRELWAYRELLYFFVWRDLKVRHKQTAIGAAWAVIQPFFTMVVFSLFFGMLAARVSLRDGISRTCRWIERQVRATLATPPKPRVPGSA
jgi:hypothetical protein